VLASTTAPPEFASNILSCEQVHPVCPSLAGINLMNSPFASVRCSYFSGHKNVARWGHLIWLGYDNYGARQQFHS